MNQDEKDKIQKMINEHSDIGIVQQKFECQCGCKISLSGLQRHLTTEKHSTGLKARKFEKLMEKKIITF
tara:strand:- start:2929 stop:3135 length:207 start_codon:yes stop_codon:yes gene_type:complete